MTLAGEDANSKLVEVVTVADVDDEDRVGNSLLQIWKLRFGHKTKLLFRLWAQGLVNILKLGLTKILSLSLVKILMLSWDLDVSAWLKLWNCLIKICVITCDMNSILGSVVPLAMLNLHFSFKNHSQNPYDQPERKVSVFFLRFQLFQVVKHAKNV